MATTAGDPPPPPLVDPELLFLDQLAAQQRPQATSATRDEPPPIAVGTNEPAMASNQPASRSSTATTTAAGPSADRVSGDSGLLFNRRGERHADLVDGRSDPPRPSRQPHRRPKPSLAVAAAAALALLLEASTSAAPARPTFARYARRRSISRRRPRRPPIRRSSTRPGCASRAMPGSVRLRQLGRPCFQTR
jgi:hypothetical protein